MKPATVDVIATLVHVVRGQRVMLDADLAALYGVPTKRLNEQIRRNRRRFPSDFAFKLTAGETANLRSQIATSSFGHGGRRYAPWVFTEQGFKVVFDAIRELMQPPAPERKRIGFQASVRR